MSAQRYRHADRLEWSSHAKLSDVQPLIAKDRDEFAKSRAIWRDNLQRAADRTPSNAIVMGSVLANYINRRLGYAWPTNELLMADTGWSESTVKRSIDDLKTGGWVMWCKLGFQQPNGYRLAFSASVIAGVQERHNLRLGKSLRAVRSDLTWLGADASQVRFDTSIRSDLTSQSGQIWPPILTKEPHHGTLEEGAAGEKVEVSARGADRAPASPSQSLSPAPRAQPVPVLIDDEDDEAKQLSRVRGLVIRELGEGDSDRGRQLAAFLTDERLGELITIYRSDGPRGAFQPIADARQSAERNKNLARQREVA